MVEWDSLSDQPAYMRKQKKLKQDIRKQHPGDLLISALTVLLLLPLVFLRYLAGFKKRPGFSLNEFFGMGVNLDKEPSLTPELVKELGVRQLLIRIHMKEMDKLDAYETFVDALKDSADIMFVLIPSRLHIDDASRLESDLDTIFARFVKYGNRFQVANAINRIKWGFVLPNEYLKFFRNVQKLRDAKYPGIRLIGPSVIDFEYHVTIRAMFNFFSLRYDAVSALLYVDRRGAPENRQFIFDLMDKIYLLKAIAALSPKTVGEDIYITETNYPIKGTGKYAPTSDYERVDEKAYSAYMVRYFLLAMATTQIRTVYWHQLIAPGYGLIDNREGIVKRGAFFAFKFLNRLLQDAVFVSFRVREGLYCAEFTKEGQTIKTLWCNNETRPYRPEEGEKLFSMTGEPLQNETAVQIDDCVTYVIGEKHG